MPFGPAYSFLITCSSDIVPCGRGLHIASTGRPGLVLIDISKDAQEGPTEFVWLPARTSPAARRGKPNQLSAWLRPQR